MTITNDLDDLMAGFCNIGKGFDAEYLVKEGFDDVGLVTIFVPEDYRRRGHARWFMERFIAILDKYGRCCAKIVVGTRYTTCFPS